MPWMVATLSLFPVLWLAALWRRGWAWGEAARIGLLTAAGFLVAAPLLSESGLGTGEAYNYSEAVADTVVQLRAGVFPVFVGQSEYAFNGRVHPLRTAAAFPYAAGALDLATFHRLGFWAVQNLTLAASLFGALFCAYGCLRRLAPSSPWAALALALLYGSSPPLLAAAYGMDLYMTVVAAPFLPVALAGAATLFEAGPRGAVLLGAGSAAAWLAHPPVAAWLTPACVLVAACAAARAPRPTRFGARIAGAAALALILGGYAFVSVLSLGRPLFLSPLGQRLPSAVPNIVASVRSAGWSSLLPVKAAGAQLGDFQLGYGLWLTLLAAAAASLLARSLRAAALAAAGLLFVVLALPVPWLNERLWRALPGAFSSLTNAWPMQRAYLAAAACAVCGFALAWRALAPRAAGRRLRAAGALLAFGALGWSAFEASRFVARGFATRMPPEQGERALLPGNANLMEVAYAYLGRPRDFTDGARDPEQEMRLLARSDGREVASNAKAGAGRIAAQGTFTRAAGAQQEEVALAPVLVLEPGKRYRLHFDFVAPRLHAQLRLSGEYMRRAYILPEEGEPNGFGMDLGHSRDLSVWTDSARPETVTLSLELAGGPDPSWRDFASFTLREVDRAALPVRVKSLVPSLTGEVDAPGPCWLETPRMAIPGYAAAVDGQPAALARSQDGTVLVAVPGGRHAFELRYPGPPALRLAFGAAAAGWSLLALWAALSAFARGFAGAIRRRMAGLFGSRAGGSALWAVGAAAAALFVIALLWPGRALPRPVDTEAYVAAEEHSAFEREAAGSLCATVRFPRHPVSAAEPILGVGSGPGSATIFVHYLDAGHVAIGLDTWGEGSVEGASVAYVPGRATGLRVTMPALHRPQPASGAAAGDLLGPAWLTSHFAVWMDGKQVFLKTERPPRDRGSSIFVMRNGSGSGGFGPRFSGDILSEQWLPANDLASAVAPAALADGCGPIRITFIPPSDAIRQCEPVLSMGGPGAGACVFINYVDAAHVRVGIQGPGAFFFQSAPLPVDYGSAQVLTLSAGRFYPQGGHGSELFSEPSLERLRASLILTFNAQQLLDTDGAAARIAQDARLAIGENTVGATYPRQRFTGDVTRVERLPPALWPARQGSDHLERGRAAGPVEITALLPRGMAGRNEPLLVTGRPGSATIIIIRYVDDSHVAIGADVWGKGLYWGRPLGVDYAREVTFRIWTSALFPERDPLLAALSPADLADLRQRIRVELDGRSALDVRSFGYDSDADEITVGASAIGGSNQGPKFTGTILVAKRLPALAR